MNVPHPPAVPLLVFDGDCGFCRVWTARWHRLLGDRLTLEPYQVAAARFPSIPRSRFRHALQLILPDGSVHEGAEAVFRSLALAPEHPAFRRMLEIYLRLPGAALVCDLGYRWVADHRPQLSRLNHFFFGPPPALIPGGGLAPVDAHELAAARHRRRNVAIAGTAGALGAVLLVAGIAIRRRRDSRGRRS
jgi:predicted DCC family thiol-disulfide oxidoreductase YuxK